MDRITLNRVAVEIADRAIGQICDGLNAITEAEIDGHLDEMDSAARLCYYPILQYFKNLEFLDKIEL